MHHAALLLLSYFYAAPEPRAYVPFLYPLKRVEATPVPDADGTPTAGDIQLLLTLDPQGGVADAEVLSGPQTLRASAIDAVRQWRYNPVLREGSPVFAYTGANIYFMSRGKPFQRPTDMSERMAGVTRLGQLERRFSRNAATVLADFEQDLTGATGARRVSMLPNVAKAAWRASEFDKASRYGNELLAESANGPASFFSAASVHAGHTVLGLVELQAGNIQGARQHLLDSAKVSGGPILGSSGPNMLLAEALIKKGEREAVLEYFTACRSLWQRGEAKLDEWSATVRGGGMPSFGANLMY